MKHEQIKKIVFTSILITIILFLSFVPNPFTGLPFGYIPIGLSALLTIIHIPVLIGGLTMGKKYGMILGFVFGLGSLIQSALLMGDNAPFTNPILSVLPRIFIGYIVVVYYDFFKKKIKKENLTTGISLALTTFTHTLVVTPIFFLVGMTGFYFEASKNPFSGDSSLLAFFAALITINGLIEMFLSIAIGLPIVKALKKVMRATPETDS